MDLQTLPITGEFVRKIALQTSAAGNFGLAVSPDGVHMVTSHNNDTLSVYSLPGGEHIRSFGSEGKGNGQFSGPAKLCFGANGTILLAEAWNKRVQEVTLTGEHVRFIGVGVIDYYIWSIAANAELIVVGKWGAASNDRIMMFDAVTGTFVRAFGDYGNAPGQLMKDCWGIRFTPDSCHIVVAESKFYSTGGRLSVFTVAGEFVRCIGEGKLTVAADVEFADNGDIIVCDGFPSHHILVFSADGSTLLQEWGGEGDDDSEFQDPAALAMCGGQLYVLDRGSQRVQVFE